MGDKLQGIAPPELRKEEFPSGFADLIGTLDQLLASKTFGRSAQLRRLLIYFGEVAGSADPVVWSETAIGANVFGRKDFNSKLDTIVRVEMRRLRQKLDEYYSSEGLESPLRLRFEKNTYRPFLEANTLPLIELPAVEPVAPPLPSDRFWIGAAWGAGATAVLVAVVALLWWAFVGASERAPREVAASPIWAGFRSTNVVVAVGTPLFFRSSAGFERNFHENLPDDLESSDQLLAHQPAFPVWNLWAPFDDIGAAVHLDRFLRSLNSTATIVPARQLSFGGLAGKRTIVMGQPRMAPLLVDLLSDQNFHPPVHIPGQMFAGLVNAEPKPGETARLPGGVGSLLMQSDESNPDHALVTSVRLSNGGEVLNVFGDRVQTGAYVIRKLTDPAFMADLNGRVFDHGNAPYRSAQIVFRVDYSRSQPTGLVYLTHRVKAVDRK